MNQLIESSSAITALAKSAKNRHTAKLLSSSDMNDDKEEEELWPKALDLLKQMREYGIEPDGFCYSSAINCCGAEGRWQEACQLIETMKRGGPKSRPNKVAYTAAISKCSALLPTAHQNVQLYLIWHGRTDTRIPPRSFT